MSHSPIPRWARPNEQHACPVPNHTHPDRTHPNCPCLDRPIPDHPIRDNPCRILVPDYQIQTATPPYIHDRYPALSNETTTVDVQSLRILLMPLHLPIS